MGVVGGEGVSAKFDQPHFCPWGYGMVVFTTPEDSSLNVISQFNGPHAHTAITLLYNSYNYSSLITEKN